MPTPTTSPELPVAISLINGRYFLFSIDVVSYLRREHRICGVLIGGLPQIPQQNVFLGLPLELMPEEARLLVEAEIAYVVDDVRAHDEGIRQLKPGNRQQYLTGIKAEGEKASKVQTDRKEQSKEKALKRLALTPKTNELEPSNNSPSSPLGTPTLMPEKSTTPTDDALFALAEPAKKISPPAQPEPTKTTYGVTPASSAPLLPNYLANGLRSLQPSGGPHHPAAPTSYPLFAHLHSKGYFLSPGLRFGCQYLVYPGDPLRFHSHFLAVGVEWDQEFDLMDIVGGGRLGTGVKKGFLIGGQQEEGKRRQQQQQQQQQEEDGHPAPAAENVRTFSIEWAGM